jgi:Yip1 domain
MSDNLSIPQPETHLSQANRVVNTFVAPSKTFTDVLRDRSWWLPFLITAVVTYLFIGAAAYKVGFHQLTINNISADPASAARMEQLPPAQQEAGMKFAETLTKGISFLVPVLALAAIAIFALVVWGSAKGFGGTADYSSVFAMFIYAGLIQTVKPILAIIVLFVGGDVSGFNMDNPVGTNAGFFLDGSAAHWLKSLLTSIDVFTLWYLVVLTIGLSVVAKLKRGSAGTIIFGWWALIVLFKVVRAALL